MLDQAYQKTEAGRAEIKARALVSSRQARNLLLMLDASKSARDWIILVQGAGTADFQLLLDHGLIAPVRAAAAPAPGPVSAPTATPAAAAEAPAPTPVGEPVHAMDGTELPRLDYQSLYTYLTREAKPRLGLMKGYRLILDVERCGDISDMQSCALKFLEQVRAAQGEDAARDVRRDLGMTG